MSTTTNPTLLDGIRAGGNEQAWREFFRVYTPLLTTVARRLGLCDADAADAVQETLKAVHAAFSVSAHPFERGKGRFRPWLRGVSLHKVRDIQRGQAREEHARAQIAGGAIDLVTEAADAESVFDREWQRDLLARALERVAREIDPVVWQAFQLYVLQNQSPDKVARLLATTRNAVYLSKSRVLKRVREVVAELAAETEGE